MATTANVTVMSEIALCGIEKETAFLPTLAPKRPDLPEVAPPGNSSGAG